MVKFTIETNGFLGTQIEAWYHADYIGGCNRHNLPNTIENIICTLKNDINILPDDDPNLQAAAKSLYDLVSEDLKTIKQQLDSNLTVCVVPRAKVAYLPHQLLFKETIRKVATRLNLEDGTDYIIRTSDTRTTHRDRAGYGGNGSLPYKGITTDTCDISNAVQGKTIILIDDVYTPSVNIDEDAIQALLDRGASRVVFYAVGHTV